MQEQARRACQEQSCHRSWGASELCMGCLLLHSFSLMVPASHGALPGRTSKTPVCIQWFLWHVCGKLCQMNGLRHTRQELLMPSL